LNAALRYAAQRRRYIDPALSEEFADLIMGKDADPRTNILDRLLSGREQQVLRLLALGHTHQHIADQIGVSAKTVETYRLRIAQKLDLHTRADIIAFALSLGILKSGSVA
jgi:two-component system, NarL family, response regulator NreC